jgi:hypothetical protein
MRRLIKRSLVFFLALALFASGLRTAAFADQPSSPAPHELAAQSAHSAHDHHHDNPKPPAIPDSCFKSCGICSVVPTALANDETVLELAYSSVVYLIDFQKHDSQSVVVDPGIPKPTG